MREIKFRAWDKKRKRMIYKCVVEFYSSGGRAVEELDIDKKIQRRIIKSEVIQYTGLKDKNGVEIYEGDIIKTEDKINKKDRFWIVTWGYDYGWSGFNVDKELSKHDEVIGNIYENPELVEGK